MLRALACSRLAFAVALALCACGEHGTESDDDGGMVAPQLDSATPGTPPPRLPPVQHDAAVPSEPDAGPATEPTRTLQIVAHEDDDLGLMSPDLLNTVERGDPLRTIYVTSGDAGFTCNEYTQSREAGVRAGYAKMAGVPNEWDVVEREFAGKLVRIVSLHGTQISLVFMGLHNGGYGESQAADLEQLWSGNWSTISTRPYDGRSRVDTYTRSQMIETMLALIQDFGATRINTLDSSRLQPMIWPFDHSDHVHSALFALAALLRYRAPHTVGMYRAYNSQFELSNVSAEEAAEKLDIFNLYLSHDPKVCPGGMVNICGLDVPCDLSELYAGYEQRQYRTAVYENITGLLRGPASQCLQGFAPTPDAGVGEGGLLGLLTCDGKDRTQHWRIEGDNTIHHLATGLCLDASEGQRGSHLVLKPCNGTLVQRFVLTTQSQLRGPDSTCVQADGNTMSLAECAVDIRQLNWTPGIYSTYVDKLIDGFTDVDIPDDPSYYGSLSFGDADGNGSGDVCVRRVDGLYCSFSLLGAFGDFTRVLTEYGDDSGWLPPQYGSTVQLGDLDGDGAAEVCGRQFDGVYCAHFSILLGQFVKYQKSSAGTDFSDAAGYNTSASRYRSLRLVDVDGDGAADLCARNATGIECAISARDGTFRPAQQWTSEQFTDALGWAVDANGSTLRYADITGDGRADVCGRSVDGVVCASNDGHGHFVEPHLWSRTGDFNDQAGWNKQPSYYGSIRLLDVDADGTSDVCGRSPDGMLCGISTGAAFSQVTALASSTAYSDQNGWKLDRYGSSFGQLDLNFDGHPDLCGWGPGASGIGLRCSLSDAFGP